MVDQVDILAAMSQRQARGLGTVQLGILHVVLDQGGDGCGTAGRDLDAVALAIEPQRFVDLLPRQMQRSLTLPVFLLSAYLHQHRRCETFGQVLEGPTRCNGL